LGGALARWLGPHSGVSKRARTNLRAAMPELGPAEIEAIVRGMWDNLGRVVFEYPHLAKIKVFASDGRVEVRGLDNLERALAAERRVVMFSGRISAIGRSRPSPAGNTGSTSRRFTAPPIIRISTACCGGCAAIWAS